MLALAKALFIGFQNHLDRRTNTLRVRDGEVKFIGPFPPPVRALVMEGTGRIFLSNSTLHVSGPIIYKTKGIGGLYHGNRRIPV